MMELKKNPKKDLNKSSGLFFATGMALVLAMTYFAFEWKTFDSNTYYDISMNVEEELIEENPIFTLVTPPPPPPPPADPIIIEVVPDDPEIEETVIATTDTDQEEVIKYEDIEVAEVIEDVDVPFAVIENVPVFPGCENASDK
ncbi:MAG: energy transducer TonB, partial [Maribacter sp.]|nr:energy transducer TonB [Maribacter sp.]